MSISLKVKICLPPPRVGYAERRAKLLLDVQFMQNLGAHQTANRMGYSVDDACTDVAFKHWVSSLPDSDKPLLDAGAGHGFQTEAAIRAGRDVIALDMSDANLQALSTRLEHDALDVGNERTKMGRLVGCEEVTLPKSDACASHGSAGVLLSHVLHYLSGGDALSVLKDSYTWLEEGGVVVVRAWSPVMFVHFSRILGRPVTDAEMEEKWKFVKTASDEVLVRSDTFRVVFPKSDNTDLPFETPLHCRSTNEMLAMALKAGFEIVRLEYFTPETFPLIHDADVYTLLVARKRA